jgi:prophage antirepressor-like protein
MKGLNRMETTKIAIFRGKQIRKAIHKDEWWFSITDIVAALTDSADTKQYIKKMRQHDPQLNSYWGTICTPLVVETDGRIYGQ